MCSTCSSRLPIRFACRALALPVAVWLLAPPAVAQRDERLVDPLARVLAAADARAYDSTLFREALHHPDPFVRRQAALAAGRIGDSAAVGPLIAALGDSGTSVRAAAAFALGLLRRAGAIAPLRALAQAAPAGRQGPAETEAVTAVAKIGGDDGAAAIGDLLGDAAPGRAPSPVRRAALLEAWRLGARAPIAALVAAAHDTDAIARRNGIYSLARLRTARGVPTLLAALGDSEPLVRAVALRGLSRTLTDSAGLDPGDVASRIRPLLADRDPHVRVNALRALATFHDSAFAAAALPLAADADVNVAVQAETTLGVLGGARAVALPGSGARCSRCAARRRSRSPRRIAGRA